MENQDSSLQFDMKDNGLSHNGDNKRETEKTPLQSQKVVESAVELDSSNGVNLLDAASSTTTELPSDQIRMDSTKKIQNSSNGVNESESVSTDNHQDDDLIRELAQFEGVKKDDDVTLNLPKTIIDENGSKLQDTSDLLKDLESDSPCPGPSESDVDNTTVATSADNATEKPIDSIELMEVDETDKASDVYVDSTTELTLKRKLSVDFSDENVTKKANLDIDSPNSNVANENTEKHKPTSEIDSDTESKLLHENSDGEGSSADIGEAISSTSTATKTILANDASESASADEVKPNEDIEVSSSGSVEVVRVAINAAKKSDLVGKEEVDKDNKENGSKYEDEVSSNEVDATTEIMAQDLNETVEADHKDKGTSNEINTENTNTNSSPAKDATKLDNKTTETADNVQPKLIDSSESNTSQMEVDESELQSSDVNFSATSDAEKYNGLSGATSADDVEKDNKNQTDSVHDLVADSGKPDVVEESPIDPTFEVRLVYKENEFKSLEVRREKKKIEKESAGSTDSTTEVLPETSDVETKHTANGVIELCNFMIDHFGAIKRSLNVNDSTIDDSTSPSNKPGPQRGRGSSKKSSSQISSPNQVTPKSGKRTSAAKRSLDKSDVDDLESKSKHAKNLNNTEKSADDEVEIKGDCCLARWTDRKYYAGRVIDEKSANKFVVLFEDGASKILSQEVIVFGTENVLPLLDQSVHVLVSDDTYEPGLVTKINTEGETVMYTVAAESKTVTCSASNIYLMDDQAKAIHNSLKPKEGIMKSPETTSSKRTGRLPAKLEETVSTISGGRSSRGKKGQQILSPEPGFSGDADVKKTNRRSNKRKAPPIMRISESSDFSDLVEEIPSPISLITALEAISGVQPELQNTFKDSEIYKLNLIAEYLGNDPSSQGFDDLLGPMPKRKTLFRGNHFILTCTIPIKRPQSAEKNSREFGTTPFFKEHLRQQIEMGGGKVYTFFEDIPKSRYKNCKLIAPHPCMTAKYVQCLAANIMPISHEWIRDSCVNNAAMDFDTYILPSGWSIIDKQYKDWKVSRSKKGRKSVEPFKNTIVLMASLHEDFSEFWQRVCKLAGAEIRIVKSLSDVRKTTKGIMLTDEDFTEKIKLKAEYFNISVVSTVWVVQSLIMGCACNPEANIKLKQVYEDDDF